MNHLGIKLLNSVELMYIGQMAEAKGNLAVYLENPVGVGEHSSLTTEIKNFIETIANAKDALDVISEVRRNDNY